MGLRKNLWAPPPLRAGHSSLPPHMGSHHPPGIAPSFPTWGPPPPRAQALTGQAPAAGPQWAVGHRSALPPPYCPFSQLSWPAETEAEPLRPPGLHPRLPHWALLPTPPPRSLPGPGQPPEHKEKPRWRREANSWTRAHSGLNPRRGQPGPWQSGTDHFWLGHTQLYKNAPFPPTSPQNGPPAPSPTPHHPGYTQQPAGFS